MYSWLVEVVWEEGRVAALVPWETNIKKGNQCSRLMDLKIIVLSCEINNTLKNQ